MKKPNTICITPAQVETMALAIWGAEWRNKILPYLGISYSQLHRYMTVYGGQAIPRPVALAMHYANDSVAAGKPVPALPELPASEAVAVKFKPVKKEKPVRIDNDAPEIDIFAVPAKAPEKAADAPKAETPAPAPEKAKPAPKASAKPKEAAPEKIGKGTAKPTPEKVEKSKQTVAKAKAAPAKPAPAPKAAAKPKAEKAAPAKPAPAPKAEKQPSLAKASAKLGKALATPEKKKPARRALATKA